MEIIKAQEQDFDSMIDIWEDSVRATHDFLTESDIDKLKILIRQKYFYSEDLYIEIIKDSNQILGFLGTSKDSIEMLFIKPECFGKKIGARLLEYALLQKGCTKVEVNEQNPRALRFYQKFGFRIVGRSEFDHQGNAFPILSLELDENA